MTRTSLPRHTSALMIGTSAAALIASRAVPALQPLMDSSAWAIALILPVAIAGAVPRVTRRMEAPGDWVWAAWAYRLAALIMLVLTVAYWQHMAQQPSTAAGLPGVILTLSPILTLAILALAVLAGDRDQRDADAQWAADLWAAHQGETRTVMSGR